MRVDVRPGVLRFARLEEDIWHDLVDLANELEERVFREVLERELALGDVAWVGLTKHGVTVARHDLSTVECRPDVLLDSLIGSVLTDLGLHLAQPDKDFLVGKTVKGTSETVQGGSKGEEGVGEGGADKFAGVSGNITTFVVTDR